MLTQWGNGRLARPAGEDARRSTIIVEGHFSTPTVPRLRVRSLDANPGVYRPDLHPPPALANINSMKLFINGEERSLEGPLTLNSLLTRLDMKADRVAVELNLGIVPREQWTTTALAEGDRLEIVHFVGGGNPGEGGL